MTDNFSASFGKSEEAINIGLKLCSNICHWLLTTHLIQVRNWTVSTGPSVESAQDIGHADDSSQDLGHADETSQELGQEEESSKDIAQKPEVTAPTEEEEKVPNNKINYFFHLPMQTLAMKFSAVSTISIITISNCTFCWSEYWLKCIFT
jgi:hypothetical protein